MKTTRQTTQRFPNGFRMILYITAVAALGFVNCIIVKASDHENDTVNRLEAAVTVQAEPEIRLEDWMLEPSDYIIESL